MQYLFDKKAKLVGRVDKGSLWLLNVHDDWIHDQYGESYIFHGRIHAALEPFHPLSTSITGFFKDDETKKWIKVQAGVATFDPQNMEGAWEAKLSKLLKVRLKTGTRRVPVTTRTLGIK